jgi:CSLREA domain-containing protein
MKSIKFIVTLAIAFSSAVMSATYTVNSLNDPGSGGCDASECTLREAIAASVGAGSDTIVFAAGTTGTIVLTSQLLINFNNLQILGPGPEKITVSGNNTTRVFRIISSNVVIKGLTIADGDSTSDPLNHLGGGISISNGASPVLEDLRIINNYTNQSGGGVYFFFAGGTIRNCEISGNTAARDSGLGINGGAGHDVLVENVTISGNTANQAESGIGTLTNSGQNVTIRYITVANNSGSPYGAYFSGNGTTTIEGSIFADNILTIDIFGSNGDFNAADSSVSINNSIVETAIGNVVGVNNIVGQDPKLSPLGSVAGSVQQVHAIANDSIALNHIDKTMGDAQCGTGVTTDQTGFPRPTGLSCDAGAYESSFKGDPIFSDGFE